MPCRGFQDQSDVRKFLRISAMPDTERGSEQWSSSRALSPPMLTFGSPMYCVRLQGSLQLFSIEDSLNIHPPVRTPGDVCAMGPYRVKVVPHVVDINSKR